MGDKKRIAEDSSDDDNADARKSARKSAHKSAKKEKRAKKEAADSDDDDAAAAKADRKSEKKRAKEEAATAGGGGGNGGGESTLTATQGAGGAVAHVRVRGIPASADAAKVAAFLGIDAAAVKIIVGGASGPEAVVAMPNLTAAKNAAQNLNETKLAGRFVQVEQDDGATAAAPEAGFNGCGEGNIITSDDDGAVHGDGIKRSGVGGGGGEERGKVVEVECTGQTGRIIGKGGAKIREIEELTGCMIKIRKEEGICEVSGRDIAAAVQEIKNIVEEGRERDGERGYGGNSGFSNGGGNGNNAPAAAAAPNANLTPGKVFGMPPAGSASRHDTGVNDWACMCGSVNFARRGSCFRCNARRALDATNATNFTNTNANANTENTPTSHTTPSGGFGGAVGGGENTAAARFLNPTQGTEEGGYEVFVKYLPHTAEEAEVATFMSQFGQLVGEVRLLRNPATGQCKGAGFVSYATEQARQTALSKDGVKFGGRHLSFTVAKTGTFGVRMGTEQPVGTHTPAMLAETLAALVEPDRDGTYVDGTFGRGGHSRGILAQLGSKGRLHAFDMDPEAIKEGKKLEAEDARFKIHYAPFGCMDRVLAPLAVSPAGVFLDLGISSPQFDDQTRGFRPEQDGPLDLRFDVSRGEPASEFLQRVDRGELIEILEQYGETTDPTAARRIADAVCLAREEHRLPMRTKEFASLVAAAKGKEYQAMHPAKLTFQALRIHLNQEFDEMRRGMHAAMEVMPDGGRLGVLTWKHSECAILVDFFRHSEVIRPELPLMRWMQSTHPAACDALKPRWGLLMDDAQRPSEKEMRENSRSRSAILHVLRKKKAVLVVDLERVAYPLRGWVAAPEKPPAPAVTFAYEEAGGVGDRNEKEKKEMKENK